MTGGTGLVGTYLLRQLVSEGKKVKALYRKAFPSYLTNAEIDNIEWVNGDILDTDFLFDTMKGIQQVYHAAAVVSFSPYRKRALFKTNIEGTANVVNAAIEAGVKKMVHVSSVSAMGRLRKNEPIDETMYWTPETSNSNYGQSKYLAELEVWRGIGEGLEAIIVNPGLIFGAADWETGSSKLFKSAFDEFPWYTDGASGFVDVRDVVKAMTSLMESKISGERFIVSAENRAYREIFTLIANEFGKRPPHRKVTPFLAAMVWRIEWVKSILNRKEPMLTRETAITGQARVEFNNKKLKKFLPGFKYIPVEQSIKDVCSEFLKRIQAPISGQKFAIDGRLDNA
ncbi:MAG TPA: NAD-dependent epimerase/dehydratase family protein [Chitinophagaceae bacterium]|nr:NAD-dependent epimerase/dehydratase family protein [Chitinophagaceae bacterium]